jgi:hypothetical protein
MNPQQRPGLLGFLFVVDSAALGFYDAPLCSAAQPSL